MLRQVKATMGSFGDYCKLEGWLTENPTRSIKPRKWMSEGIRSKKTKSVIEIRPVTSKEIVTEAEITKILAALGDSPNPAVVLRRRTIVQLMVLTGLRISECLGLTTDDILDDDADTWGKEGSLQVNKQAAYRFDAEDATTWLDPQLKTANSYRKVPLSEEAHALLVDYRDFGYSQGWLSPGELLFQQERVKKAPLAAGNVGEEISKAAERAGIERRIKSHYFRHTYASRLFSKGADYRLVATLIGNTEKVCKETYVHFIKQGTHADHVAALMARS